MEKYKVKDIISEATYEWTIRDILNEINRDRHLEWIPYTEDDWREGWELFCEGDLYTIETNK